ncbi:MAG: ABC-2 transporter permease [Candidatus Zixiibacteriota bacterium]|nr:MAG: ABC-2 transporter permease [candidate division Zixibacteria bacterium]
MMEALLIRDLITQRFNILLGAFYSLIFIGAFGLVGDMPEGGFVYIVSGIAVGYMILLGSFGADKNETPRFMLSLPATRWQAVTEKFVLLFVATAFGTLCAAGLGALAGAFPGVELMGIDPMHILRIVGGMLVLSFVIPFYFKFGHQMIRYLMFTLLGVGVVAQIVAMVLLSFLRERQGPVRLFGLIMDFVKSGGSLERNLWLVGIGAAVCLVSYLVSLRIYLRRDI